MNRIQPYIIVLLVFGQLLAVNYGILDYALIPRWIFLSIFAIGLILWQVSSDRSSGQFKDLSILLLALWLVASIVSWKEGIDFAEYGSEVGRVAVFFGVYCVLLSQLHNFQSALFTRFATVAIVVIGASGVWQLSNYSTSFDVVGMEPITGLMSNKNLFAEYLGVILPFSILGIYSEKRLWKAIHVFAVAIAIFFILILFTRSVWVGLFLASSFAVFIGLVQSTSKLKLKLIGKTGIGFLVFVLVAAIAIDVWSGRAISDRLLSLLQYDVGSAGWRIKTWVATFGMISEHWLTGVGAGNWKIEFQQFGMAKYENTYTTETLNDYIGVFSETGVFGFIGYTGFIGYGLIRLIIKLKHSDEAEHGFLLAAFSALVVFAVVSFFNFPKNRMEHMTMALFLVAHASYNVQKVNSKEHSRLPSLIQMFLLPLLIASGFLAIQRFVSEGNVRNALESRKNQDWQSVIHHLEPVNPTFYSMEPSTTPVSWYKGLAHFQVKEYDQAFDAFITAYEVNPYHVHVLNNLATSYEVKGDHNKAIELYHDAMRINEHFPDALLNLIAVYFNQGRFDEALSAIENSKLKENGRVLDYRRLILQAKENAAGQK